MSFLDDFDSRAARKPGEPAREGETSEDRELLEFADLIRSRQGVPQSGARERLLERVRTAQAKTVPAPTPVVVLARAESRRHWIGLAGAALIALIAGVALISSSTTTALPRISSGIIKGEGGTTKPVPPVPFVLANTKPVFGSTRTPNEEFANLTFPTPQMREGDGAAVETKAGIDSARLVRVQGLVLYQVKGESRWRVANRGQVFNPGDSIRTSKRLESSARILSPDGSAISISNGALARYENPRLWNLAEGNAFFEVAKRADLPAFSVNTPRGEAKALGTAFGLDAGGGAASSTLCWVEEGKVAVAARGQKAVEISAGASALMERDTVRMSDVRYSKDWLAALERVAANDHGIGQLIAKAEKANEHLPLEVKSHSVTVTVVDQVARTFVDQVFVNNTDRRLEGVFYYPLPADASISEFAMYVGDQRIVGEVLEQHHARQIFEYIVRQQRDPALLEYAGGNLFKMRIFPIEPHSEKRIQLGYTQILARSSGKVTYTYPLYSEMLLKNPLLDLRIDFRVQSSPGLSELVSPTHAAPSALSDNRMLGALSFRAKKYSPTKDFTVTYSVPDGPECVAFTNKRPDDPLGYFMLQLCPKATLPQRVPPQRVLVVVDGSASATPQEYAVATEFAASAADVSSNWEFGVMRGGQRPQTLGAMSFADANTSANVREFLEKAQPLGATDLLETFRKAAALVKENQGVQLVYVGDGIDTVSELSGRALVDAIAALFKGKDVKVSTVATGSSYDRAVLQGIAAKLGGTFSRVEGASDVHAGVGQVFDSFYRPMLWDVMVNIEGAEVSGVYPEYVGSLAAGDTAVVLGRFNTEKSVKARVTVAGDFGGTWTERSHEIELSSNEISNRYLPRLWAKAHIDNYLGAMGLGSADDDARTKQNIIQTSMTYQIMSPFTAFLVLESEEDYARFGIKRKLKMQDWKGEVEAAPSNELTLLNAPVGENSRATYSDEKEIADDGSDAEHYFFRQSEGKKQEARGLNLLNALDDAEFPSDVLERAELSDHFETVDYTSSNESPVISARSISLSRDASMDGRWANASTVRSMRLMSYDPGAYTPQYNSLVFSSGTVIEIQIDQPLRSAVNYQRLLASGKGTLSTHLNLSLSFEQMGRFEDALKALAVVLQTAPANVDLRLQEGSLRYRSGDIAGGKAAFARALELSAEKDRAALRERVAQLLYSLGQYPEATEAYTALARSAETPEVAVRCAQSLTGVSKPEVARGVWDELLKRWPNDAKVLAAAAMYAIQSKNFERGEELVRAARKIDPNVDVNLIGAYAQNGKREAALTEFRTTLAKADASQVYSALTNLVLLGCATEEALRILRESTRGDEMQGAMQYLQSYSAVNTRGAVDAVLTALKRPEFPESAAMNAFYVLHQARQMGAAYTFDPTIVAAKIWKDPRTEAQWNTAAQALRALNDYQFHKEALEAVRTLAQHEGVPDQHRAALIQIELNALSGLSRDAEVDALITRAFEKAKTDGEVYPAAMQVLQARLNRSEWDAASALADEYAKRFPAAANGRFFYLQVLERLQQGKKYDAALALLAKLEKSAPLSAQYLEVRARVLASQGNFREASGVLREAVKSLATPPEAETKPVPKLPEGKPVGDLETANRERTAQLERWREQRARTIRVWAQVSAQDTELRAAFLKEVDERAKQEDPVAREWTEAALTALKSAGETDAHLKRLQALAEAEPNDPLWTRRWVEALTAEKKFAAARTVLEKLAEADPRDIEILRTLINLSNRMKDEAAAERYLARIYDVMRTKPRTLQQFAEQWQSTKPEWGLKAWNQIIEQGPVSGFAANSAGLLLQKMGKQNEAREMFLRAVSAQNDGYTSSAWSNILTLAQKEEHARPLLERAHQEVKTAKGNATAWLNLLIYRVESMLLPSRREQDRAAASARMEAALDAALKVELMANDYNAGNQILHELVESKQYARAEKYFLQSANVMQHLVRQLANNVNNVPGESERAERLFRWLLARPDGNAESTRTALIQLLVRKDRLDEAEVEVRKLSDARDYWDVASGWNALSNAYFQKREYSRAMDIAYEGWKSMPMRQYAGDALALKFLEICKTVPTHALKEPINARINEVAKVYFSMRVANTQYAQNLKDVAKRLGTESTFANQVKEAGASDDPIRVVLAAYYYRDVEIKYDTARTLLRRALTLPGADTRTLMPELYRLLTLSSDWQSADWAGALDVLETIKAKKIFSEWQYWPARGRCLNQLNRIEESREAYRKVLSDPLYLRQHWSQLYSLAYEIQSQKDWLLATEAWEVVIRRMRGTPDSQRRGGNIAEYYRYCALAYVQLGEKEKAIDCILRALSVIPRTDSGYKALLDLAVEHVLKGTSLDKAVEEYEKAIAASGGEKPHLRIAYAEAYRKANQPIKMLRNLGIAANLLPKDMTLRQQIVEGYKALNDNEAVLAAYREWAKFDPQNIEIYRGMGDFYEKLGRRDDALLAWATMAEVRPREAEGYRAYAVKLTVVGKHEEAAVALRHALRYRPTEFEISDELAKTYTTLKQSEKIPALWTTGETKCRKAMEDFADDPLPWLSLARFLVEQRREKEARELYRDILNRQWPRFQNDTYAEANKRLQEMGKLKF